MVAAESRSVLKGIVVVDITVPYAIEEVGKAAVEDDINWDELDVAPWRQKCGF